MKLYRNATSSTRQVWQHIANNLSVSKGLKMPSARALTGFVLAVAVGSSVSFGSFAACTIAPPSPFTDAIEVESKYDPSDATKSNPTDVGGRSAEINSHINSYSRGIVSFADRVESAASHTERSAAIDCLHSWLGAWSVGGALLGPASDTGQALRVWTLSSISSALLKLSISTPAVFDLTPEERTWLGRLAYVVRAHHAPRFVSHDGRMNNHDYWAAWAVASTSAVLRSRTLMDYPVKVFEHAMSQVAYDRTTDSYYLPNEAARGSLGLHYTHFAVTPLAMMAAHLPRIGYPLKLSDTETINRLVSFAIKAYMAPELYHSVFEGDQVRISASSFAWLRVHATTPAAHPDAVAIFQKYASNIVANARIGGRLDAAYR